MNNNCLVQVLVVLIIIILILFIFRYLHNNVINESFCYNDDLYTNGFYVDPMVKQKQNDFTAGVPYYNVGTTHTGNKCQQKSIELNKAVNQYQKLTRDQANKKWSESGCNFTYKR